MKFRTILILLVIASLADIGTTIYGINYLGATELNPFLNFMGTHTGSVQTALFWTKILFLAMLPVMTWMYHKGNEDVKKVYSTSLYIALVIVTIIVILNLVQIAIAYFGTNFI